MKGVSGTWIIDHIAAPAAVFVILFGTAFFWNVSYDGYQASRVDFRVLYIEPDGVADQAGLQLGDKIIAVDGKPSADQYSVWNFGDFVLEADRDSVLNVIRDGQELVIRIPMVQTVDMQFYKVMMLVLALCCWATGYFLGVVRLHASQSRRTVAATWLLAASLLSMVIPFQFGAHGLFFVLLWLLAGIALPLFVYMHLQFPVPFASTVEGQQRITSCFWASILTLNLLLALVFGTQNFDERLAFVQRLLPVVFVICGSLNALLLVRGYRRAQSAHQRRQIRIITATIAILMLIWLLALVVPPIVVGRDVVRGRYLAFLSILLPLSYLLTGASGDLIGLDRLARRAVFNLAIATVLIIVLAQVSRLLDVSRMTEAVILSLAFLWLIQPAKRVFRRLVAGPVMPPYHPLEIAAKDLNRTLNPQELIVIFTTALQKQFDHPAIAVFLQEDLDPSILTLRKTERIDLEVQRISGEYISRLFPPTNVFRDQGALQLLFARDQFPEDVCTLLTSPSLILWWNIAHPNGLPLMLVGLGMRDDLDPYRPADLAALDKLGSAASRAFGHSTSYTQLIAAEETVRHLLQKVRSAEHDARRLVAHRIHGTVLAEYLQKNIRDLRLLEHRPPDSGADTLAVAVLDREERAVAALRDLCAEIFPVGLDDPLGLEMVLAIEVERARASWNGNLKFDVTGEAQAVDLRSQAEALEIVRLAITNAIQHADASTIHIVLEHPSQPSGAVMILIGDNGRNARPIRPKPNHFGIPLMLEGARAIGGSVTFEVEPKIRTTVRLVFPAQTPVTVESQGSMPVSRGERDVPRHNSQTVSQPFQPVSGAS